MEYFVLPVRWGTEMLYLLYFSNDDDGVVLGPDRRILACESQQAAESSAKAKKLELQEAMEPLDLATLQSWLGDRKSVV